MVRCIRGLSRKTQTNIVNYWIFVTVERFRLSYFITEGTVPVFARSIQLGRVDGQS